MLTPPELLAEGGPPLQATAPSTSSGPVVGGLSDAPDELSNCRCRARPQEGRPACRAAPGTFEAAVPILAQPAGRQGSISWDHLNPVTPKHLLTKYETRIGQSLVVLVTLPAPSSSVELPAFQKYPHRATRVPGPPQSRPGSPVIEYTALVQDARIDPRST